MFGHEIVLGKIKRLTHEDLEPTKASIARFFSLMDLTKIMVCNSTTLSGTRYCPGINTLIQIGYTVDGLPEFGNLVKICYASDQSVFLSKIMESVRFLEELNSIEISEPSLPAGLHVSHPSDLPHHHVHHSYSSGGKKYIPFRQYIFDG